MWVTAAGVNPIQMIIYSQVVAGMVMPFLVWAVYRIVNDRETMREHVNSRHANIVIIFTLIVLIAADTLLVVDLIK